MTDDKKNLEKQFGLREKINCDVLIVGAGPAGLSAAIRVKQLCIILKKNYSVYVLEKGSEVGSHIISGAIFDPIAFSELFPNWKNIDTPLNNPVTKESFLFLTNKRAIKAPNCILPTCFKNDGNYIISLSQFTRWLGLQAKNLGVEIFEGFAAQNILYTENNEVKGIITNDVGIDKDGYPTSSFQLGVEVHAQYTLFAEGSRGHLGKELIQRYKLDAKKDPQSYSIGLKELWVIDQDQHQKGSVIHTTGWPSFQNTYSGGFLYHLDENQISIGLIIGLSYSNPRVDPFQEFQRYKMHPSIRCFLERGKRIAYGARSITTGGLNSLPKVIFPGGALIGCDAGYLNIARIKGTHTAMKSGILAAEAVISALQREKRNKDELHEYPKLFKKSWLYTELKKSRNVKIWMSKGFLKKIAMIGLEQKILNGYMPWTVRNKYADHTSLQEIKFSKPIQYKKPDGIISFDKQTSLYFSNTNHKENQPSHLLIKNKDIILQKNLRIFGGPEQFYCPANVYEYFYKNNQQFLQINAQNCLHCKTCDIKDPFQNIFWIPPEGGGGPNYSNM